MLTPELHRTLKLHSVAKDTTINDSVVAAIKSHLQNECNTGKGGYKRTKE